MYYFVDEAKWILWKPENPHNTLSSATLKSKISMFFRKSLPSCEATFERTNISIKSLRWSPRWNAFMRIRTREKFKNMWNAIESAKDRFSQKWNHIHENDIRVFMQNPSQIAGLQAVDYCLWSLHRVYHHKDFRYYHYLQDKFSLVHDLSYGTELYGTYFNKKKPITQGRFRTKKWVLSDARWWNHHTRHVAYFRNPRTLCIY